MRVYFLGNDGRRRSIFFRSIPSRSHKFLIGSVLGSDEQILMLAIWDGEW